MESPANKKESGFSRNNKNTSKTSDNNEMTRLAQSTMMW